MYMYIYFIMSGMVMMRGAMVAKKLIILILKQDFKPFNLKQGEKEK